MNGAIKNYLQKISKGGVFYYLGIAAGILSVFVYLLLFVFLVPWLKLIMQQLPYYSIETPPVLPFEKPTQINLLEPVNDYRDLHDMEELIKTFAGDTFKELECDENGNTTLYLWGRKDPIILKPDQSLESVGNQLLTQDEREDMYRIITKIIQALYRHPEISPSISTLSVRLACPIQIEGKDLSDYILDRAGAYLDKITADKINWQGITQEEFQHIIRSSY
jgi:hypothetical protein